MAKSLDPRAAAGPLGNDLLGGGLRRKSLALDDFAALQKEFGGASARAAVNVGDGHHAPGHGDFQRRADRAEQDRGLRRGSHAVMALATTAASIIRVWPVLRRLAGDGLGGHLGESRRLLHLHVENVHQISCRPT